MMVRGISLGEGELIASQVGVRLYNVRLKDNGFDCKLLPLSSKYKRLAILPHHKSGKRYHINAVCYHGYRAFMTAVFELEPTATIKTGMAAYHGVQEFCDKAEDVAERKVSGRGAEYADQCDCYIDGGDAERTAFYSLCSKYPSVDVAS